MHIYLLLHGFRLHSRSVIVLFVATWAARKSPIPMSDECDSWTHSQAGSRWQCESGCSCPTIRGNRSLTHTDTHTPWAVSFRLWGWTQGRCCRRHRVSVSAAAGTGSHAQRKQANAACTCHKPVVWPWVVCMDRSHLSTARMQVNDKQCTRTMETGRARPRLVSTHDRTRMCNAVDEATTTCQQPHQRRDALLLPFARRTRQKRT